jgi:hypothetical protein
MATSLSTRPTPSPRSSTMWLARVFAAVCVLAAVYLRVFDAANSQAWLSVVLIVGAALVVAGCSPSEGPPRG